MADWMIVPSSPLLPLPCGLAEQVDTENAHPLHDTGLGYVLCFGQRNISRCAMAGTLPGLLQCGLPCTL